MHFDFKGFFRKKELEEELQALSAEEFQDGLGEIKKAIRKQGVLIEMSRNEILNRLSEKEIAKGGHQPFIEMADSFFFLENSLRTLPSFSDTQAEAVVLVRHKLEALLAVMHIEAINQTGVSFDPAEHEAIEKTSAVLGPAAEVDSIIQPGYKYRGILLRPAKVALR